MNDAFVSQGPRQTVYPRPRTYTNPAMGGDKPRPSFECRATNKYTHRLIIKRPIMLAILGHDTALISYFRNLLDSRRIFSIFTNTVLSIHNFLHKVFGNES